MPEESDGPDSSSTRQSDTSSRAANEARVNAWRKQVRPDNEQSMENIPEDYEAPVNAWVKRTAKQAVQGAKTVATQVSDWAARDAERSRLALESQGRGESSLPPGYEAPVNAWVKRTARGAFARFRQTTRQSDVDQDLDTDQESRDQETPDHDSFLAAVEASTSQEPAQVAGSPYEGAGWDAFVAQMESLTPQPPAEIEQSRNPWAKELAEQRARDALNPFAAMAEKERQERIAAKQKELTAARQGDGEQQQDMDKGKGRDDSMSM